MPNQAGGFMFEDDDLLTTSKLAMKAYKILEVGEQAARYNTGKPELSFVFDAPLAMEGLANRFSLGAKKYSRDNWKKGLPTVQIIDSLLRHISAYQNGEMHDEDGGMHVDAIVWNAVVLSEQFHRQENPIVR